MAGVDLEHIAIPPVPDPPPVSYDPAPVSYDPTPVSYDPAPVSYPLIVEQLHAIFSGPDKNRAYAFSNKGSCYMVMLDGMLP
ncbi:MAG: hypothetical protein KAI47_17795 [Deltaproteobacteria bacterium]|nr:hypothetical protein [Deltaproteobacteria bacterium]